LKDDDDEMMLINLKRMSTLQKLVCKHHKMFCENHKIDW